MKLFKHAVYNKNEEQLLKAAKEIVDNLVPRYNWEEVHSVHIEYVLSVLRRLICQQ